MGKSAGQVFYEAMMDWTGGRSRETGNNLREWPELDPEDKRMYEFCAQLAIEWDAGVRSGQ